ncbi:MAG TPA: ParB N-terminal domain-containing protein [Anaeromyxobacteraceae bacterium]|nr:ParB N-terminal domain-containing protein [Anaeromyxobacteraceae bacterium]
MVYVQLDEIADDATFRLREEGDVSALAASLGRLGQLVPVELRPLPGAGPGGPRYQLVSGFRRVEALRCLLRERVLARVHPELGDEDAWAIALCEALIHEPLDGAALDALRARLAEVRSVAWADELIGEARARAPVDAGQREAFLAWLRGEPPPRGRAEGVPETVEITPEQLAEELAAGMYDVNADLALAFESWDHLPPEGRRAIVEQARYVAALLPHLKLDED